VLSWPVGPEARPGRRPVHGEVPVIVSLLRERRPDERRVLRLPHDAARLREICDLKVETGAGRGLGIPDDAYAQAGARITASQDAWESADFLLKLKAPTLAGESRPSGCCLPRGLRGMPGRRATSGGWSRRRSRPGGGSITGAAARRCGRRGEHHSHGASVPENPGGRPSCCGPVMPSLARWPRSGGLLGGLFRDGVLASVG
jgi:hypothetical protein